MDSASEPESWRICPVCRKANPAGTESCRYCWGGSLGTVTPISSDELKTLTRKRQFSLKLSRILKPSLISLLTAAIVYLTLYTLTDIVSPPPQEVNSVSRPGEWAMFRHDLEHSGSAGSSNALPEGRIEWSFATGASINSSPAVAGDTVYIGSRDGKLYALDAASGAKRWEYKTDSWVESSPVVAAGIVYFGSNDGNLYALDAASGQKLWEFQTPYPIMGSAAFANGIVYFGAEDYNIYALDAATGKKLWQFQSNGLLTSSPTVANGIVYIGSGDQSFYALDGRNGRRRLRFKAYSPIFSSPVVSGETVYIVTSNAYLYAINGKARTWPREHEIKPYWIQLYAFGLPGMPAPPPQSGFLWGLQLGKTNSSSPLLMEDTLYVGADNKLLAIDLINKTRRWQFEARGTIRSSPAMVGNTLYVGSEDGRLYAVDASTGKKLWDITTKDRVTSSPAVANGMVYIGSHDGNIYAIK